MADLSADERRRARAAAAVKIIRPGGEAAAALEDARYWERIPLDDRAELRCERVPVDERAELIWQLSVDACSPPGIAKR